MGEIRRNHITIIFDDIFSLFIKVFVPLFILFFGRKRFSLLLENKNTAFIIVISIIILITAYSIMKWYKKVFFLRENFLIVREGVFIANTREIPLAKIQTINISQNIRQKIFNTSAVKIDTGNTITKDTEIAIVINKNEAELLKESLVSQDAFKEIKENTKNHIEEKTKVINEFTASFKDLFLTGLTSNAIFAGAAFLLSAYAMLDDIIGSFINTKIMDFVDRLGIINYKAMSVYYLILSVLAILIFYLIFSFSISIAGSFLKYYRFSSMRDSDNIIISYGLIESKKYIIPIKKIKAVYVKQNLIRQLFGIKSLHVESIGYGNEKGESAILFPIIGKINEKEIISKLLPEFIFHGDMHKVPKKSLLRFIISPLWVPIIICVGLSIFIRLGLLLLLLLPIFAATGFLEYKNSAISKDGRLLCICNKALFKTKSYIPIKDIQSTAESTSYFQRRAGLFNFEISIQSNIYGNTIKIKNLSEHLKEELMNLI